MRSLFRLMDFLMFCLAYGVFGSSSPSICVRMEQALGV